MTITPAISGRRLGMSSRGLSGPGGDPLHRLVIWRLSFIAPRDEVWRSPGDAGWRFRRIRIGEEEPGHQKR